MPVLNLSDVCHVYLWLNGTFANELCSDSSLKRVCLAHVLFHSLMI